MAQREEPQRRPSSRIARLRGVPRVILERVVERVLSAPRAAAVLAALILCILAAVGSGVRVDGGVDSLLPIHDRGLAAPLAALRGFGLSRSVFIDVAVTDASNLERAARDVREALAEVPGIESVAGHAQDEQLRRTARLFRERAPLLLPVSAYPALPQLLSEDAILDRFERHFETLNAPGGSFHVETLRGDPLGIAELARTAGAEAAGLDPAFSSGRGMISGDGLHTLVVGQASVPVSDDARSRLLVSGLDALCAAPPVGATLSWLGGHRFYASNAAAVRRDVGVVSIAGVVLVLGVVVLVFRSTRVFVLCALAAASAALGATASLAVSGRPASGIALAFAAALSGIAVDYVIHLHAPPRGGETRSSAVRRVFRATAGTVSIGAITSAAAFAVLGLSPIPAHRDLGLAAAAGVVTAWLFALVVGPAVAVLPTDDAPAAPREPPLERLTRGLMRHLLTAPRQAAAVGALLIAVCAPLALGLRFESDVSRFESKDAAVRAAELEFGRTWGSLFANAVIVSSGSDEETAMAASERVVAAIAPHVAGGDGIRGVLSLATFLPSRYEQERRAGVWREFWTPDRLKRVRTETRAAAAAFGLRTEELEPYLDALGSAPPPLVAADLDGTPLAPILERHIVCDGVETHALVVVTGAAPDGAWREAVRRAAPDAPVVVGRDLGRSVAEAARRELVTLAPAALAVVALLLWVYHRSVAQALVGLVPLLGGLTVTAGALALMDQSLNMLNVPVALPICGLGVDYALFLQDGLAGAPRAPAAAAAHAAPHNAPILGVALSTLAGSGAMLLARHPAIYTVGLALSLGVLSTLVLAWLLVPALVGRRGGAA